MPKTLVARKRVTNRVKSRLEIGNYHKIARKAQITPQHVSRVLRGKRAGSLSILERIADAADVTLSQLYTYIKSQTNRDWVFDSNRVTVREKMIGITEKDILTAKMIARMYKVTPMGGTVDGED